MIEGNSEHLTIDIVILGKSILGVEVVPHVDPPRRVATSYRICTADEWLTYFASLSIEVCVDLNICYDSNLVYLN